MGAPLDRFTISTGDLAKILEPDSHRIALPDDLNEPGNRVKELYANLVTPSYAHGYSLAIEFMNRWFEKGFDKDYFKSIYIDGKHVIDDYKKFSKMVVKGENPRARIAPTVDYDFDREGVDFYVGPPNLFLKRSRWQDAFFKDYERNLFLNFVPRAMRMNFNFKVRVNSRSQQLDIYNKMEINFRIGATLTEYISVDFHVPKTIVLNIAKKAGFEVVHGEVLNIIEFLHYLNRHSELPWLFKLRAINQKPEYFIRIDELYTHINNKDKLSLDDGERDGKLDFNFHVEMNSILDMAVPYFYAFYAAEPYENFVDINGVDSNVNTPLYSINIVEAPKEDEHGWAQACITDYYCDEGETSIDLTDLFTGDNVLNQAVRNDLLVGVSPLHFINIKIIRDADIARGVNFHMDWDNYSIVLDQPEQEGVLHIAIYIDRDYINTLEINLHDYNANRLSQSEEGQQSVRNRQH